VAGYAYHQLLKSAQFASAGARYLVASEPFGVLSRKLYRETEGASERLFGDAQRDWFVRTLRESTRTFKLWGSSLCFMPRRIDMTGVELLPPELRTRISITTEDWDGCPNERQALLGDLAEVDNVVVLAGDLHCFFVGTPFDPSAPDHRVVEFVTGSVSSSTWLDEIRDIAATDPSVPPEVALAASGIGSLLTDPVRKPNPHLAFHELERNGITVMEVDAESLRAELLSLPPSVIAVPPSQVGDRWSLESRSDHFRVTAGGELERDFQGRAWRWDIEQATWVAS
jgi:alkaline phosphatase D